MTRIWILLGLVVVVGAAALVTKWDDFFGEDDGKRTSTVSRSDNALPAIEASRIAAIEIKDSDKQVRIARQDDAWVLPERFGVAVVTQRLEQLLNAFEGMERSRMVGKNPAKHATFQVTDDQGKTLKIEDDQGQTLVELIVGKQDNSRGYEAAGTFVRPAGQDQVYLHPQRLVHLLISDPAMWMKKSLATLEPTAANELVKKAAKIVVEYDDVLLGHEARTAEAESRPAESETETEATPDRVRLVLACAEVEKAAEEPSDDVGPTRPNNPPTPTAGKERKWTLSEPEANAGLEVYTPFADNMVRMMLIGQFSDVVARYPSEGDYGFEEPMMHVKVDFTDGTSRSLKVGKPLPEDEGKSGAANMRLRYAHVEGSPFVVSYSEFSLMQWKKKPDELKLPSTNPGQAPTGPKPIALPDDKDG